MSENVKSIETSIPFSKQFVTLSRNKMLPAIGACILFFILGEILSPGYLSTTNIGNILASAAILALAGAGQTLVILSGHDGIDLSVGQVMSLSAVATYMILNGNDAHIPLALVVIIAIGAFIESSMVSVWFSLVCRHWL